MAPFPEAEDMTIKRLYVALKRGDVQLLQMGAHKLHEKFHTGHKFELIEDLKQILNYVQEQPVPADIKELLVNTISDILSGNIPEISKNIETGIENSKENPDIQQESAREERVIFTPEEAMDNMQQIQDLKPVRIIQQEEQNVETVQQTLDFQTRTTGIAPDVPFEIPLQNEESEINKNAPQQQIQNENPLLETNLSETDPHENQTQENPPAENTPQQQIQNEPVFTANEPFLNNVAVFYDDKASFIDYAKNKLYKMQLDKLFLNQEASPEHDGAAVKNIVDVPAEEIGEILKMLNMIKGNVYFTTTSKSENIIKTFIENGLDFQIPLVTKHEVSGKNVVLIPLFGLSNIFVCPKCGEKEYFGGFHNKVLSMQCKNCSSAMYPDISEAQNLDTNANPYYWIYALNSMSKSDVWILVNPPLEASRALAAAFIKSAFEISHPKKVYILSKETTKREYYRQIFKEINSNCEIKADYQTQDLLCEEFINREMSAVRVNV